MKKIIGIALVVGLGFGFPGMKGMMGGQSGMAGSPIKGLKDSTILAVLNGKPIKVEDINRYLQGITGDPNIKLQQIPANHVGRFVREYVDISLLYSKAKEVEKSPQFQGLKRKIAVEYWLKNQFNSLKISDKEIEEFYNKNKELYFKAQPKVKARHIVVKDEKTAQKLIEELKGLGGKKLEEKFAQLAKKYSTGPSRIMGGELGWFDPKQMVPEFTKAVNKLKVGEMTQKPVKTRFGYHIILVEGKQDKNYRPLKAVRPLIINYLKQKKIHNLIQQIRKSAKIEYKLPK